MMNFTDEQLINLSGGTARVSRLCEVTMAAVTQWKTNGIPRDKFLYLASTIEKESHGLLTRKDMFPQSYHIIWPELAQ